MTCTFWGIFGVQNSITFVQIGNRGTVTEASGFNPDDDAQKLREAMKGAGETLSPVGSIISKASHALYSNILKVEVA